MGQPNGRCLRDLKVRISVPCGGAQGRFAASPGTTSTGNGGILVSRSTKATMSWDALHEGTMGSAERRTHAPSKSRSNRVEWWVRGRSMNKIEGEPPNVSREGANLSRDNWRNANNLCGFVASLCLLSRSAKATFMVSASCSGPMR
jgi:hypothetical protein